MEILKLSINKLASAASKYFLRTVRNQSKKRFEIAPDVEKIRNIGIMAHVDAGKTTTTERMLYYAGFLTRMGNVDEGNTAMDYMKQEQERGITINAASISFPWNDYQYNVIDTPGHVDFAFEVERSSRVLDGAVIVIDGASGVESQTLSVWYQANRYKLPRIIFVNKMDHLKASLKNVVQSVQKKLKAKPLLLQIPIKMESKFIGVVDLVSMTLLLWDPTFSRDGSEYLTVPLKCHQEGSGRSLKSSFMKDNLDTKLNKECLSDIFDYRSDLIDELAMIDTALCDLVLNEDQTPLQIDNEVIMSSIRSATLHCATYPMMFGSALRNKGVQPLLDSIAHYLPSPSDKSLDIPEALKDLFAFAFKVTHDPQRGALVYLRIYSGFIKPHSTVYNITQNKRENITRLLLVLADEHREVELMGNGNIACAVGMKYTNTGDTVINKQPSESVSSDLENHRHILKSPVIPDPMFFCTFEPLSAVHQSALDNALHCLKREDPSIGVINDEETGQRIVSGMGELHLEVIQKRLKDEYKVDANIGRFQVAYRETITNPITINESLCANVGSKSHSMDITLTLTPSSQGQINVEFPDPSSVQLPSSMVESNLLSAFSDGIRTSLLRGPLLSYPVSQVDVSISSLSVDAGTSVAWVTNSVIDCVFKAIVKGDLVLLEPFVKTEILVHEEYLQVVLGDVSRERRGMIESVEDEDGIKRVQAILPVASLSGYSSDLRNMTSGMAGFSTQFSHYAPVNDQTMKELQNKLGLNYNSE